MEALDPANLSENQMTIREVVTDLTVSEAVRTDWSKTLCSAPSAISALGGCAILSSLPTAACVSLDYGDEGRATLPAKLFECNQIGRKSFVEAQARMQSIRIYSSNVGPLLDKILALLDEPQTAEVRKALEIYMRNLEKSAAKTTQDTVAILEHFEEWKVFTVDLENRIAGKQGDLVVEQRDKKQSIRKKEIESGTASANVERAQSQLDRHQARLNDFIRMKETARAETAQGMGVAAAAAMGNPYLGLGIAAISNAPIVFAQAAIANARERAEKEALLVSQADKEREMLMADLRELQHDGASLEDVRTVLSRALERLTVLQVNVETILIFFKNIKTEVQNLVELHTSPLLEQLDFGRTVSLEERNELVRSMTRQQGLDVKVRFTIMQKLAQVYCEVSEQYILSGFDVVQRLSLFQSSISDDEARRSDEKLEDYRTKATAGIEGVTKTRKKALIESLQAIVERDARGTIQKKIGPA